MVGQGIDVLMLYGKGGKQNLNIELVIIRIN